MLVYKDIEDFYNCFQEHIGNSNYAKLDEKTIDMIYNKAIEEINHIRDQVKNEVKQNPAGINLSVLTTLLEQNCITEILNLLEERSLNECGDLSYTKRHLEYRMWARTLLYLSWTLRNLKGKVEVGHCQNDPAHRRGVDKMLCPKGSKFHLDFYNECLQSFENIIEVARLNPPKLVEPR